MNALTLVVTILADFLENTPVRIEGLNISLERIVY